MSHSRRVIVPDLPHHVTQRGVRRMTTFWAAEDYDRYVGLLAEGARRFGLRIWAYCLMPNHVHLIALPSQPESLSRALQWTHSRYAVEVNRRRTWSGHVWQQRFYSAPIEPCRLPAAVRYVLANPVRARLAEPAVDWPWSSAGVHLRRRTCPLIAASGAPDWLADIARNFDSDETEAELQEIRRCTRAGAAIGGPEFRADLEQRFGVPMVPRGPGRPAKSDLGQMPRGADASASGGQKMASD